MLTKYDEFLCHQIVSTFDHVETSDRMWTERTWFSAWDTSGRLQLVTSIGYYPNRNVMDAYGMVAVEGKKYFGSLGAPEDPDAWQDNLGDVKRAAKRKNLNLYRHDEHVVKAREVEPKPETPYRVADDLVDKYTGYAIQDDPQIAETPQQVAELKEQVRKELTPADAG